MNHADWSIIEVDASNLVEESLFCAKNPKDPGFKAKAGWLARQQQNGMRLSILKQGDRKVGFIEWVPAEFAWRPIDAPGYLFIQCIMVAQKADRHQGAATFLIDYVSRCAQDQQKTGVAVITSTGSWMADEGVFKKSGFTRVAQDGRFDLLAHPFDKHAAPPQLIDWASIPADYPEWTLLYANQCPWHLKAAVALRACAEEAGIDLFVHEVTDPKEAQTMPGGYGTFALIHEGKVLADHYISTTRFKNILRQKGLLNS